MRFLLVVVAALALAGSAFAGTAKPTPDGTLKAEVAAFNAKNDAAAYAGYSAAFKKQCPFAKFKAAQAKQRAQIPNGLALGIKITSVKTSGSTAVLGYKILLAGSAVATISGDKFVKVGGLWYDEVDSQTTC